MVPFLQMLFRLSHFSLYFIGGMTMPSSIQQIRAISTALFLISTSKASVSQDELREVLSLLSNDLTEAIDNIESESA